ncbi:rhoptry family protein [Ohtaekwangia koreensis]|uniref:Uncharacterized protein n=1 Tax=Ohtaekwangia koreensis TaxID=688867 RepID=A0A1T5J3H8_9BACT|nr:hypothetical protein [Ohtaekwangia koreensis]SKC45881.1 hypothetical protein SAMN05660236_0715 [Ohtaekwangia koreensis]
MKPLSRRDFIKKSSLTTLGLAPVINALSQILNVPPPLTHVFVKYGYRLTLWRSLLNLDFYFVNFKKAGNSLVATYDQPEPYMIVKLPQQHIAEQSVNTSDVQPIPTWTAQTFIAGYSYLVFRVMFYEKNEVTIDLNEKELLNWNSSKFQLVIKPKFDESIFANRIQPKEGEHFLENSYPMGYIPTYEHGYNPDYVPKMDGDPITAIEAPWRLVISPRLPDQNRFRFNWEFSNTLAKNNHTELWLATLTIVPLPEIKTKKKSPPVSGENQAETDLDEVFQKMDVMFIGSPDHPHYSPEVGALSHFLPTAKNRQHLVSLYITHKLLARADKLAFSSLGISTFLDFKNTKVNGTSQLPDSQKIDLYTYKHLISFGRDEEVEVSRVILEKETGLKMLLIKTTKRRTTDGLSFLDYREYVMPLEIEKDYQHHVDSLETSKFNGPFRKVRFLETDPKRIIPLDNCFYETPPGGTNANANIVKIDCEWEGVFYPHFLDRQTNNETPLTFQFEVTDWHEQKHKVRKSIQAITCGIEQRFPNPNVALAPGELDIEIINKFFDSGTDDYEKVIGKINSSFNETLVLVTNLSEADKFKYTMSEQLKSLKDVCLRGVSQLQEKLFSNLVEFENIFTSAQDKFLKLLEQHKDEFKKYVTQESGNADDGIRNLESQKADLETKLNTTIKGTFNDLLRFNLEYKQAKEKLTTDISDVRTEVSKFPRNVPVVVKKAINQALTNLEPILTRLTAISRRISTAATAEAINNYMQGGAQLLLTEIDNIYKTETAAELETQKSALELLLTPTELKKFTESLNSISSRAALPTQWQSEIKSKYDNFLAAETQIRSDLSKIEISLRDLRGQIAQGAQASLALYYKLLEEFQETSECILSKCRILRAKIADPKKELMDPAFIVKLKSFLEEGTSLSIGYNEIKIELDEIVQKFNPYFQNPMAKIFVDELELLRAKIVNSFLDASFGFVRPFVTVEMPPNLREAYDNVLNFVTSVDTAINENALNIKNAILTYRSKIGYAINQIDDEVDDFINEELSALETDFIVLSGVLKEKSIPIIVGGIELQKKVIDFFHQYASIPELKQASVYIPAVCKLVNEEVAVGINYAKDYVTNQVDLYKLETKKNVSRVFAEIKDSSRAKIEGKIRNISEELGGIINPELPTELLSYLRDPKKIADELIPPDAKDALKDAMRGLEQIKNDVKQARDALKNVEHLAREKAEELEKEYRDKLKTYKDKVRSLPLVDDLVLIGQQAKEQWNDIRSFSPETYFKSLEAKLFGSITLKDILGLDFELPRLSPSKDAITYNFITKKLKSKDFGLFAFTTDTATQLQVYLNKNIKDRSYESFVKLTAFRLAIKLASEPILSIKFKEFEIKSNPSNPKKVNVKIDSVSFGGPLDFFAALAEKIKMPGSGLRILPSFNQLEVGYAFPIPGISSPAFNFTNMSFDVAVRIPYANATSVKAMLFDVGINRANNKFLISAGIFGGRGHFTMTASPHSLEKIDAAIEFGGYIGINLGIASGYVFLFAGIRLIYERSGDLTLVGYVICQGGVTVFGFISIYLTVELAMTYRRVDGQAALYGSASLTYSIKIGFFRTSFGISFSKQIMGAKGVAPPQDSQASILQINSESPYASTKDEPAEYLIIEDDDPVKSTTEVEQEKSNSFATTFSPKLWEEYCCTFDLHQ